MDWESWISWIREGKGLREKSRRIVKGVHVLYIVKKWAFRNRIQWLLHKHIYLHVCPTCGEGRFPHGHTRYEALDARSARRMRSLRGRVVARLVKG